MVNEAVSFTTPFVSLLSEYYSFSSLIRDIFEDNWGAFVHLFEYTCVCMWF